MNKNIAFIIKANQDFVRHTESDVKKNKPILNSFFESISNVYLPLLDMLDNFEKEGLFVKVGLVLPPVLCSLLSDEAIQTLYSLWLDERNEVGKSELSRNSGDSVLVKTIESQIERNIYLKKLFEETYKKDLIKAFADNAKKGYIELLGTCGTDIFFPHYTDMKEIISAQVESGLHSYRQIFGFIPDGFWLPDFGYTPGAEKLIRTGGISPLFAAISRFRGATWRFFCAAAVKICKKNRLKAELSAC